MMSSPSATTILATRIFTDADQRWFVHASGDANPIHADHDMASLMFSGGIIVHGMHTVAWALESYFQKNPGMYVRGIRASFSKPIKLNERVVAKLQLGNGVRIAATCNDVTVTTIDLTVSDISSPQLSPPTFSETCYTQPIKRDLHELEGITGQVFLAAPAEEILHRFPTAAEHMGGQRLIGLCSLATLVGMECPGLYGVSTDIAVETTEAEGPLFYKVEKVDKRFNRARLAVNGYGLRGSVTAFVNIADGRKSA